jgi:hypothetical protein
VPLLYDGHLLAQPLLPPLPSCVVLRHIVLEYGKENPIRSDQKGSKQSYRVTMGAGVSALGVAEHVRSIGGDNAYAPYAARMAEGGVDGQVVLDIREGQCEVVEALLDDLAVSSELHRAVLRSHLGRRPEAAAAAAAAGADAGAAAGALIHGGGAAAAAPPPAAAAAAAAAAGAGAGAAAGALIQACFNDLAAQHEAAGSGPGRLLANLLVEINESVAAAAAAAAAGTKKGHWTAEEDELLAQGYALHGTRWVTIAKQLKGRDDTSCYNHWQNHKGALMARVNVIKEEEQLGGSSAAEAEPLV